MYLCQYCIDESDHSTQSYTKDWKFLITNNYTLTLKQNGVKLLNSQDKIDVVSYYYYLFFYNYNNKVELIKPRAIYITNNYIAFEIIA